MTIASSLFNISTSQSSVVEGYQVELTFNFSEASSPEQRSSLKADLEKWLQDEALTPDNGVCWKKLSCEEGSTVIVICLFVAKGIAGGALAAMGGLFFRFLRSKAKGVAQGQDSVVHGSDADNLVLDRNKTSISRIDEEEKLYQKNYGVSFLSPFPLEMLPRHLAESKDYRVTFEIQETSSQESITNKYEAQYSNGELKSIIRSISFDD